MSNEQFDRRQHWETIYGTKPVTDVSWFEAEPQVSLELIEKVSPTRGSVIDVGGGASRLVDRLLDADFQRVAVVDISATALDHAKTRLGAPAAKVQWIVGDVTEIEELGSFDVWHDRAVFHFLTDAEGRRKYIALAKRTIPLGGHLIIGAFAVDGPLRCSGLEVCRYDAERLMHELGEGFTLIDELTHTHSTPTGKPQKFFFGSFQRVE
jgi:SAM-dependent methyltransferase